jgi:hypothetical protein
LLPKEVPTFYFVGVTTGKSSINKVFPLWMDVLGRPEVVLRGIDHPIHDDPEALPGQRGPDQVRPQQPRRAGDDAQDRPV